ncbi:MAG: nucleotide exchange factor GrpE [Acidobacteriota bacterium]
MGQTQKEPRGPRNVADSGREFGEEVGEVKVTDRRRVTVDGDINGDEDASSSGADPAVAVDESSLKERLAEAEGKRLEAERQVTEFADRFRKAQSQMRAENDELRQRLQRNFEHKLDAARGDLVGSLLDSLDNLQRAVAAGDNSDGETDLAALIEGFRATAVMFEARLKSLGLTVVESLGDEFNPEVHEAVEIVPVPPEQDNRVVAELQPGYRLGDRLLRPARVRVGRSTAS